VKISLNPSELISFHVIFPLVYQWYIAPQDNAVSPPFLKGSVAIFIFPFAPILGIVPGPEDPSITVVCIKVTARLSSQESRPPESSSILMFSA
jgi:hypothetical protein